MARPHLLLDSARLAPCLQPGPSRRDQPPRRRRTASAHGRPFQTPRALRGGDARSGSSNLCVPAPQREILPPAGHTAADAIRAAQGKLPGASDRVSHRGAEAQRLSAHVPAPLRLHETSSVLSVPFRNSMVPAGLECTGHGCLWSIFLTHRRQSFFLLLAPSLSVQVRHRKAFKQDWYDLPRAPLSPPFPCAFQTVGFQCPPRRH
jgi:hypothetical protein